MEKVILLRDYRGLPKGTELFFSKVKNAFGFEEIDENIGDDVHSRQSRSVYFSKDWVEKAMGKLFADPSAPVKTERELLIENYETRIEKMQEQLIKLRKEGN